MGEKNNYWNNSITAIKGQFIKKALVKAGPDEEEEPDPDHLP